MDINLAETIADAIVKTYDDATLKNTLYMDYSGRGMYGETTAGVVVGHIGHVIRAIVEHADMFCVSEDGDGDMEPLFPSIGNLKIDEMGLDEIVYGLDLESATAIANVSQSEIQTDYSGRGMYGETTVGIIIDDAMTVISSIIKEAPEFVEGDDVKPRFPRTEGFCVDGMGQDIILY